MAGQSVLRRCVLAVCAGALLVSGVPAKPVPDPAPAARQAVPAHGHGSLIWVPHLERNMTYDAAVAESAVIVGDSQTGPDTWVDRGLTELGYRTVLRGAGGTGYTVGNGTVGSYYTALTGEQWLLPYGTPALVVLQGGGNDAARAADTEIAGAAQQLIREMRRTYPGSRLVMVGVISTAKTAAGLRRAEVDDLLAGVAAQEDVEFLSVGDWWDRHSLAPFLERDGVHFTAAGHEAAGSVFAEELGGLLSGSG